MSESLDIKLDGMAYGRYVTLVTPDITLIYLKVAFFKENKLHCKSRKFFVGYKAILQYC